MNDQVQTIDPTFTPTVDQEIDVLAKLMEELAQEKKAEDVLQGSATPTGTDTQESQTPSN